jgi:hypothetical protein
MDKFLKDLNDICKKSDFDIDTSCTVDNSQITASYSNSTLNSAYATFLNYPAPPPFYYASSQSNIKMQTFLQIGQLNAPIDTMLDLYISGIVLKTELVKAINSATNPTPEELISLVSHNVLSIDDCRKKLGID